MLTIDEYSLAVEEAIEVRDIPYWKILDLRLNLKFARRRGVVDNFDMMLLDWAGRPWSGPVVDDRKRPTKAKPGKQGKLF